MRKIIITIDGYAGSGKSSTAREVAKKLKYKYLNSGALYRAISWLLLKKNIKYNDKNLILNEIQNLDLDFSFDNNTGIYKIFLNNQNITSEIYTSKVDNIVSKISHLPEIREKVNKIQQNVKTDQGLIAEGRDMGTIVFPKADLKFFMIADIAIRAKRRLLDTGLDNKHLDNIIQNLKNRDALDISRANSPLKKSMDSIILDSTNKSFQENVNFILKLVNQLIN